MHTLDLAIDILKIVAMFQAKNVTNILYSLLEKSKSSSLRNFLVEVQPILKFGPVI